VACLTSKSNVLSDNYGTSHRGWQHENLNKKSKKIIIDQSKGCQSSSFIKP